MSAILKFDFQKWKQLRLSEVNYLNYTKKDQISHVTATFSLKQGETRTNSVPISHPLSQIIYSDQILQYLKCWYLEMVNMDLRTSCTDIFKCLRNTLKWSFLIILVI